MNVVELDASTWPLAESLFSTNKTVSWCFCTWFMQTGKEMRAADNREVLRARLGTPIGLLAVDGTSPSGGSPWRRGPRTRGWPGRRWPRRCPTTSPGCGR